MKGFTNNGPVDSLYIVFNLLAATDLSYPNVGQISNELTKYSDFILIVSDDIISVQ